MTWELKGIHSCGIASRRDFFVLEVRFLANSNIVESIPELGEVGFMSSKINYGFTMLLACSVVLVSNFILS